MLKKSDKNLAKTNRFNILSRTAVIFLTVFLALPLLAWIANTERIGFAGSNQNQADAKPLEGLAQPVTVNAEGRGTSRLKFNDGRDVAVQFKGAANPAQGDPLTLAAADFNSDGYEDVIGGYSSADGGIITLYRTNSDSIAPSTEKIHTEMMNGRFPAPFLPEAVSFAIPEAADFIGTGDFNRDGLKDVLTAARGGLALHLLAGDGRGNFRYERKVELPGAVTTMLADDVNNYDGMADAIVGIGNGYAPKALIYHNADGMFDRKAVEMDLPADAASLAVGQMDADVLKDLVIAAGSEVLISRGYDQTTKEEPNTRFERVALSSTARSVATGEFVFDREIRQEIAVLLEDGTVNYLARGNVDRRPYTAKEQATILEKRRNRDYTGLEAFQKSSLRKGGTSAWAIAESPITSKGAVGESAKLVTAQLAGLSTDDLMVIDAESSQMRLVQNGQDGTEAKRSVVEMDTESGVMAAVALRLNVDTAPDIVVLQKNSAAPKALLSPTATINVSAAATDVIANNGQCSLREAIINANNDNQSGSTDCTGGSGADTIMMPAMTFTLAIGPFDDDQLLIGFTETSGDLDIGDGDGGTTGDVGDLTIVGVAGSSIVQAGTTTTNGIDRVFDVNNFVSPGTAVNATFTNLTIRHGKGFIAPFGYFHPGAGIQFDGFNIPTNAASSKTLTLNSSTVTLNRAAGQGGGILTIFGAANLVGSTISSNLITDTGGVANWTNAAGGGMSYDGSANTGAVRTFQMSGGTTFTGNAIDPSDGAGTNFGQGGGARLAGGASATISGNITNNDAQSFGGGFSIDTIPAITISSSTITGNDANTNGGGLFSKPVFTDGTLSTLTLTSNTIQNNRADVDNNATNITNGSGGGIFQERGNLTITGGNIGASGQANTAFNGGGIGHAYEGAPTASIINNTTITINNTPITFNTARASGGGIFHDSLNQTSNSTVTLGGTTNVDLISNLANVNGGGISVSNNAVANLTRATVRSNKADNDNNATGDGGGVYNATNGVVTITGATSPIGGAGVGNTARNGGGIANAGGTVTISGTGASITHNTATGTGGGISNNSGTLSAFTTATITNNTATGNGGGIFNSGTLGAITGPTLNTNSGATGGGIFSSSGPLSITNGTVSSNTATTGKGGGIEHSGTSASSVSSVTINGNTGSGIHITGTGSLDATSNTITNNTGDGITKIGTGVGSHFNSNTIHTNGELGIDLLDNGVTPNDANDTDTGPNNLQNFPVINWVRRGDGIGNVTFNGANGSHRIQYYANTSCDTSLHGEGEVLLASHSVTIVGNTGTFATPALAYGSREQITAIATHDANNNGNFDDDGSTSEFSACRKVNTLPTITPQAGNTRQQGSPVSNTQIAVVADPDQTLNTLVVTVNGGASATVNGVTLSNIVVSAGGFVTADIVASCTATNATFTLRVTDTPGEFNEASLTVTVTPNTPPTVGTYPNPPIINAGSGTTVTPSAAPTDNGSIAALTGSAPGFTGTFSGNTTTGVITISNAGPFGVHTVTVTATDNCGATTTTTFQLTVNAIPTITGATLSRQQGSPSSNSQIATVNDADQTENTLVVTVNGGASATVNGVTVSGIAVDASGNVTANVVASCTATNATFTLRVTDSNGAFNEATLTVNVTPNSPPTVGTYSTTNLTSGGGTTVTPSAAPADNGSITSATVAASGAFTGTLAVNPTTGVVTISNANPGGSYTISVTYTDNCGATTIPTFTLNVTYTISGTVIYGTTPTGDPVKPVPGVTLNAVGTPPVSTTTALDGTYTLSGLGSGPYTVTPSKPTQAPPDNNGISFQDASEVAKYVFNQRTFTANELIAADATGNGTVTLQDASEIAKRAANITSTNIVGQWKFVPASRTYPSITANLTGENYDGILVGDVTGNWTPPTMRPEVEETEKAATAETEGETDAARAAYNEWLSKLPNSASDSSEEMKSVAAGITVLLPNAQGNGGTTVLIPVTVGTITAGDNVTAYDLTVTFDPLILQPAATPFEFAGTLTGTAGGYSGFVDTSTPSGTLRVGAFGTTPITGSGTLIFLRFNVLAGAAATSPLNFTNFTFGEGTPGDKTANGTFNRLGPTAAAVSIDGRVVTANGRAVSKARVTLTDQSGQTRTVVTNPLGYYRFTEIAAGGTYVINVAHKQYQFDAQTISANENLSEINFIALEKLVKDRL